MSIIKVMEIDELRKKHQKLIYKSYDYILDASGLTITAHFVLSPHLEFHPQVTIHGVTKDHLTDLSQEELNTYVFHIGMAEIFSYWKAAAPQVIEIQAGQLNSDQINFWHNLLIKGMGEYFYVNQIDFTQPDFVQFTNSPQVNQQVTTPKHTSPTPKNDLLTGTLLPLGGGKDSLLSLELLKSHYPDQLSLFALNPTQAVTDAVQLNSNLPYITATRVIDPQLLALNTKGYLNGHTPFSSYLAFLTTFVARLFKIKYIAISNERSSNEESVIYKNHPVNHQYSKSFQLESDFQNYSATLALSPTPLYFSLLRPLYELQIAQLFSRNKEYFPLFKSCNKGQKSNTWCNNCSKCLFAYLILYPFLNEKEITTIFNTNLLNNESLWDTTKELLGYSHQKPLDCVGTHEESLCALYLCYQKEKKDIKTLSKITGMFEKEVLPHEQNLANRTHQLMTSWNNENALPVEFDRILKYVHQSTLKT
jgi:hypothetical protein